jgi:hypothetical protein
MSFHVPEAARVRDHPIFRSTPADGNNGAFELESVEPGWMLAVIASEGDAPDWPEADGWEHVSVHAYRPRGFDGAQLRTPTWREMCFVKNLFWDPDDVAMQLHPRRSEYVNEHPHVLHIWRSRTCPIPTPPRDLV